MRRAFVSLSRRAFNAIYRRADRGRRDDLVVFLSRQTDVASYDFSQLAREFEARGWTCIMHLKKVRARNIFAYAGHVARELKLLATCKIAVLDRYDPVVSLLDFECDGAAGCATETARATGTTDATDAAGTAGTTDATDAAGTAGIGPRNLDFPRRPMVLQVWHAFGAYKKFGFQSVGTPEGHSSQFTDVYNIHRNYSWVLCSCQHAREAFSEAFSCPIERIVALVRPEYDELVAARRERNARRASAIRQDDQMNVLMAPTLRKDRSSAHPIRDLHERRMTFEDSLNATVAWSFHPLDSNDTAPGNVSSQLMECDCVVTDYSSIAYEAYLLGIPVVFYVPDLDAYRRSPGLNADPGLLCPELCMRTPQELASFLQALATDSSAYPHDALERFAATGFDADTANLPGSAASRIVDFALEHIEPHGNSN